MSSLHHFNLLGLWQKLVIISTLVMTFHLWPKSNPFISETKWTFVSNYRKFSQDVPEIFSPWEQDRHPENMISLCVTGAEVISNQYNCRCQAPNTAQCLCLWWSPSTGPGRPTLHVRDHHRWSELGLWLRPRDQTAAFTELELQTKDNGPVHLQLVHCCGSYQTVGTN